MAHRIRVEGQPDPISGDHYGFTRLDPGERRQDRLPPVEPGGFHCLVIALSYFLYWHGHDPTQLLGCTAALRTELERT